MTCQLLHGDALQVLLSLPACSVDAVITDPPYELGFMGKAWDRSGIANSVDLWRQVKLTMKPGAYLLAFGGTRTYHRMVCAIEDAGFEIRDSLHWLYGQGFPKSLDVSKAIDREAGAEHVVGTKPDRWTGKGSSFNFSSDRPQATSKITIPATDAAKHWEGWGTALKPAHEPIVLARAPLAGTVAANVQQFGTGALNIDASRIGAETAGWGTAPSGGFSGGLVTPEPGGRPVVGRWPANVLLSCCGEDPHLNGCPVAELDRQSGERSSGMMRAGTQRANLMGFNGAMPAEVLRDTYGDAGAASRFFYVSKPSGAERDRGIGGAMASPAEMTGRTEGSAGLNSPRASQRSARRNIHPTVKPLELLHYLVRLITPPGGTVLDPFCGSGTTGIAALSEGCGFIGIDLNAEYLDLARQRLGLFAPVLEAL